MLLMIVSSTAFAWNWKGHQIVVAIAQRHLTEEAKAQIDAIIEEDDLKKEASWMDKHRNDEPIKMTTYFHTFQATPDGVYDPNGRFMRGDALHGMRIADYDLTHQEILADSVKLLAVRMIIHFTGDFHCPVHANFTDISMGGTWYFNGEEMGNFHHVYDAIPSVLYKNYSPAEAAEMLDVNITEEMISKWLDGDFIDWINRAAVLSRQIYDINPPSPGKGKKELAPDTYTASEPIIAEQLLAAGYQLAYLLNKYFN